MSKVGKKPIIIPEGISITDNQGILEMKKGDITSTFKVLPYVELKLAEGQDEEGKTVKTLEFSIKADIKQARANWGTTRALVQNIIKGMEAEFEKGLEIEGIGYRANMEGENLILNIGYSHPVKYVPQEGIKISVEKNNIKVVGRDKIAVGQTAAEIRAIKKPEPYKGKGIRYKGEIIKKKAGKKAGAK